MAMEGSIVWECCRMNNTKRLHEIVSSGTGISTSTLDSKIAGGTTGLIIASGKGYSEVVQLLLEDGADPNIQNKDGESSLHRACHGGHVDIIRMLLDYGADCNILDTEQNTPLHLVAATDHIGPIELLIDAHADTQLKNVGGQTPFTIAQSCGNKAAATFIRSALQRQMICAQVYHRVLLTKVTKQWHAVAAKLRAQRKKVNISL